MIVDRERWIRRFHAGSPTAVRLVCFPHAGGSASFYHPMSERLSPAVETLAVQYPGRQDRRNEPHADTIPALADAIFEVVRPLAGRPLTFFGHSMGAILAYEVAVRLEQAGAPPLHRLFASGRRAPSIHRPEFVHRYDDDRLIAELRLLNGAGADMLQDPEIRDMVLPAVRSDYRAIETYRHASHPPLSCPITVLLGDDDPRVGIGEGEAWARHTTGDFHLRVFPGGHFYLTDRSDAVIAAIATELSVPRAYQT
jgi:pyochelin biosynthetic protein PchC